MPVMIQTFKQIVKTMHAMINFTIHKLKLTSGMSTSVT